MSLELILISVSVLSIIFLVSIRYFGLMYAKNSTNGLLLKSDQKIYSFWLHTKKISKNTYVDLTDLIKDTPQIILHLLNMIFYKLYKVTKKLIDLIKGNKIKKDGGSVSIYLKGIEKKISSGNIS